MEHMPALTESDMLMIDISIRIRQSRQTGNSYIDIPLDIVLYTLISSILACFTLYYIYQLFNRIKPPSIG
jgi:hypothetical protein